MAITQREIANQMIRQLRILDPSVSGDIGTPERKILDTVAQAIADAQVDLTVLSSSLDIDSKFGDALDQFTSVFGFSRQKGAAAIGVVEFSRDTPSTLDVIVPGQTQLAAANPDGSIQALFITTQPGTIIAGQTVVSIPVRAVGVGSTSNVAANTITQFAGDIIQGVTTITNPTATTGGIDQEGDAELKIRFKNTLFRNLAGTQDQYLALAVAGAFTNKANVVGPISRYREYLQVPTVADSVEGNGNADEYTTSLSTIPYSEYFYSTLPSFVSNGSSGINAVFYNEGLDFKVNSSDVDRERGDAFRAAEIVTGNETKPNVTFMNIYADDDETVEAVRPGDVVLFEHSYVSSASRNNIENGITNCVDVYINGANETPATTVIPKPTNSTTFVDNENNRYHFQNYRRLGEPEHRPLLGNVFTPLFWTPIESLPDEMIIDNYSYVKGLHYWPVIDVSEVGGTVRARTGIEWSTEVKGFEGDDLTGPNITVNDATSVEVKDYTFDKNVIDLQASLEGSKQVTTDVLVHKATKRYFKLDLTIMYLNNASVATTNTQIQSALRTYLDSTYFGSVIQLSDLLQVVHSVPNVDNVRWSNDLDASLPKVTETDVNGVPRLGGVVDRTVTGAGATQEIQNFYITGDPTGGFYRISHGTTYSDPISFDADLTALQTALTPLASILTAPTGGINAGADGTPEHPYRLEFVAAGPVADGLVQIHPLFDAGERTYNRDFFLNDNELATIPTGTTTGDTVAGLILRRRAQNTWR